MWSESERGMDVMGSVTEAIHQHHAELAARLGTLAAAVADAPDGGVATSLVEFLRGELLPHARGEERHLYPALDPIIRAHGTPTATMRVDHEFIEDYVRRIAELAGTITTATPAERPALSRRLERLAIGLEALLEVHLAKEERVYLPLVERHMDAEEQRRVLDDMHDPSEQGARTPAMEHDTGQHLDVRPLPPARRHSEIFATFGDLRPGESFVLVNDHDPKPLFYQFNAEHAGAFSWDYLEEGPEVWRVRIGRVA